MSKYVAVIAPLLPERADQHDDSKFTESNYVVINHNSELVI